jgi:hypothetical protein
MFSGQTMRSFEVSMKGFVFLMTGQDSENAATAVVD